MKSSDIDEKIDEIDRKIDDLIAGMNLLITMDSNEVASVFIEKEVFDKKGNLSHLKDDPKIKELYDSIIEEMDEIQDTIDEMVPDEPKRKGDEYSQKEVY